MTFGTILGASFQVMRRNPRPTLGISVLLYVAITIISGAVIGVFAAWAFGRISSASGEAQDDIIAGSVLGGGLSLLVPAAASVVLVALVQGLVSLEVARGTLGEKHSTRELLRRARGRIGALIGWSFAVAGVVIVAALLAVLVVALVIAFGGTVGLVIGILLAVLAGLAFLAGFAWIGTKVSLVPSALLLERLPLRRAIARSWTLTHRTFWRTLGIELLVMVLISVASQIISVPLSLIFGIVLGLLAPTGDETVTVVATIVFYVLTLGFSTVLGAVSLVMQSSVAALLYLDLRMRKEGLDLELLRFVEARATGRSDVADPYLPAEGSIPARTAT
jgi:hypothetical protein